MFPFYTLSKYQKTFRNINFFVFSGGMKWENWLEMGSDVMDLPLPKKHYTEGFYLSHIFVHELNIGICGLVFCIQFKCRGKVIHNPGKIWQELNYSGNSFMFLGQFEPIFDWFCLNPCVQREKGSFMFKFFLGFQTFFESKFHARRFSKFTDFMLMVIKLFFTCNNAKLKLKVKIFSWF